MKMVENQQLLGMEKIDKFWRISALEDKILNSLT
jgi:hypothetical protein